MAAKRSPDDHRPLHHRRHPPSRRHRRYGLLIGLSALASACGNGGNQGPSGTDTTTSPVTTSVSPTEKSINPTGGNVFHPTVHAHGTTEAPVTTTTASGLAAVRIGNC